MTTYAGTIGIPANLTNLTGANDNIALVLGQSHTGELNLTGNNTYNGGTRINGGALGVVSDANLGASSASIVLGGSSGSGTLRIKSGAFNSSRQVAVAIGGGVVDTGSFSATMTGPLDGAGELTKVGTGQLNVTSIRTNGLEITEGEIETLVAPTPASEATVSDVASFFIAGGPTAPTARLDLANNAMIIGDTPGPEVESAVGQYIGSGFSSGNWTGNGITSSQTDLVGSGHFGLGYGEVGALGLSEFLGRPVQAGDTVVRYTRYGDANVDGTVSLADFNALAANFGSTAAVWRQGDFNYDRLVNLADFNLLAGNFGLQRRSRRRGRSGRLGGIDVGGARTRRGCVTCIRRAAFVATTPQERFLRHSCSSTNRGVAFRKEVEDVQAALLTSFGGARAWRRRRSVQSPSAWGAGPRRCRSSQ